MSGQDTSSDAFIKRKSLAEEALNALRRGEVDVIIGEKYPLVVLADLVKEEMEKAATEWQATFDAIPEGICILDENQKVLRCNKGMENMFHASTEEIVGRNCWEIVHGTSEPIKDCPFRQMKNTAQAENLDQKEEDCWINHTVYPMEADAGTVRRAVHIFQDITQRIHAQENQALAEAQLRQSQKMESIGRLAGGVAHDFNNMLSVIIGYSELILAKLDPETKIYRDIQEINKAGIRSTEMTTQLLAFSRKQTIQPRVLDLNDQISRMLKMLRRLIGEDIELVFVQESVLSKILIDPTQVDQILANLCVNARDAIAGIGKIYIETKNISLDEAYCQSHVYAKPGEYILLSVTDDGCGMDENVKSKIFEPFFTTKAEGEGTGLGLATIYGIVKQNDGLINVYSEPGQGTTFKIYIPRYEETEAEVQEEKAVELPKGHGETIMLVEDEEAILEMAQYMLEQIGYSVIVANTPKEALLLAQEQSDKIELLMTDVVMPGMNGKELAGQIHASHPELKILFMSGYTADVIAHRGVLDEGVNFINKPFSLPQLAQKVFEVLKQ